MGWNRREKQGELFDKVGRFIVIKDKEDNLAAFVNWRFDIEECDEDDPQAREQEDFLEVLYCYEVQIKSDHRSKQLGRLLMDMLLSIAKQSRMRKIMLTVFLSNQGAQSFYSKLGYTSDLISPLVVEKGKSTTDYDIMSLAIAD
jgi:GNAT superfamily N-acetyltransferase